MMASEEDVCSVALAEPWGEKEESRQIALLEECVQRDNITRIFEALESLEQSVSTADSAITVLPPKVRDKLHACYLDYAITVVSELKCSPHEATSFIRGLSLRETRLRPYRSHLFALCNGITAALAIRILERAARSAANMLLKFKKASDSALFRMPLFAYGPELNKFRHRLR
jgi:hypothetical protein